MKKFFLNCTEEDLENIPNQIIEIANLDGTINKYLFQVVDVDDESQPQQSLDCFEEKSIKNNSKKKLFFYRSDSKLIFFILFFLVIIIYSIVKIVVGGKS